MARIPSIALMGACFLVAACGAPRTADVSAVVQSVTASPTAASVLHVTPAEPTRTPITPPTAVPEPDPPSVVPGVTTLRTRFPVAASLLEGTSTRMGVAVVTLEGDRFVGGDQGAFALASVVKIPVMIATFERARLAARPLTDQERRLLDQMIVFSSNNATDVLWRSLGEGAGVQALLEPLGITGIEYVSDGEWGDSRSTPLAIAELLDLLIGEESPLAYETRAEALLLMQSVVADQRWGASAGVDLATGSSATLAIKNGWYPEPSGWLLNTAGIITIEQSERSTAHIVVVLTEGAETQTAGVRAIEEVAAAINHALVPPALVVTLPPPVFATATPSPEESPSIDGSLEGQAVSEPEPPPPPLVTLVAFAEAVDVLVPVGGRLIGSNGEGGELTLWYELGAAAADELLASYAESMLALGWLEVAGPPSVVLSKGAEGRWVGLSLYPSNPGSRLVEVTIAPMPGVFSTGQGSP